MHIIFVNFIKIFKKSTFFPVASFSNSSFRIASVQYKRTYAEQMVSVRTYDKIAIFIFIFQNIFSFLKSL